MIGPLGRPGAAANLRQHCPQMTQWPGRWQCWTKESHIQYRVPSRGIGSWLSSVHTPPWREKAGETSCILACKVDGTDLWKLWSADKCVCHRQTRVAKVVWIPCLDGIEVAERSVAADTAAGREAGGRTRTETHHVTAISRPPATWEG